ncbi:MAG: hypothetical protein ACF8R7_13825 [Phycisphaerales bacterium JB039]
MPPSSLQLVRWAGLLAIGAAGLLVAGWLLGEAMRHPGPPWRMVALALGLIAAPGAVLAAMASDRWARTRAGGADRAP